MATLNGKEILGFIAKGQLTKVDEITPRIGENGNWFIGPTNDPGNDTGVTAEGKVGPQGETGNPGRDALGWCTEIYEYQDGDVLLGTRTLEGPYGNYFMRKPEVGDNFAMAGTVDMMYMSAIFMCEVTEVNEEITDEHPLPTVTYNAHSMLPILAAPGETGPQGEQGISPHIGDNGNWFIGDTDTGVQAQGPQGEQGIQGPAGTLDQESDEKIETALWTANLKSRTLTYDNLSKLIDHLTDKITRPGPIQEGDHLCVKQTGIPVFWVSDVKSTTAEYTYVSDEQTLTDINNDIQIGKYIIKVTETNKSTINGVTIEGDMTSSDLKLGLVKSNGGFIAGADAGANVNTGAAVGKEADTVDGGAVGYHAITTTGAAVGQSASSLYGGAAGRMAKTQSGGAVGADALSKNGFAGGFLAQAKYKADGTTEIDRAVAIGSHAIAQAEDAAQIGMGTNTEEGTLQFRDYQLLDSDGKIPSERLPDDINGGTNDYNELQNRPMLNGQTLKGGFKLRNAIRSKAFLWQCPVQNDSVDKRYRKVLASALDTWDITNTYLFDVRFGDIIIDEENVIGCVNSTSLGDRTGSILPGSEQDLSLVNNGDPVNLNAFSFDTTATPDFSNVDFSAYYELEVDGEQYLAQDLCTSTGGNLSGSPLHIIQKVSDPTVLGFVVNHYTYDEDLRESIITPTIVYTTTDGWLMDHCLTHNCSISKVYLLELNWTDYIKGAVGDHYIDICINMPRDTALAPGKSVDKLVFNSTISDEKMISYLSQLPYDIPIPDVTEDYAIFELMRIAKRTIKSDSLIYDSNTVLSVYAINLNVLNSVMGTSGYAIVINDENFKVKRLLYISEYSEANATFLSYSLAEGYTPNYSAGNYGWVDTDDYTDFDFTPEGDCETINYAIGHTPFNNKVSAFIGRDTRLWDVLSMLV